jgi:hypothetical protein
MRRCIPILSTLALACTASPRDDNQFETSMVTTSPGSTSDDSSSSTTDETSSSTTSMSTGPVLDVGSPDTDTGIGEVAEVFGHSGTTLYRMDPETKAVATVGAFSNCGTGSIIDIALTADSQMYGVTFSALYEIDKETAACTLIAMGDYPTSLSFVPAGTLDPNEEALVGFVDEQYIRIDLDSGATTPIATLAGGLASSGDVVSVEGGGTYLTVTGPNCDAGDCIIQFDPSTGAIVQNFGPLPYQQVFGLAFWAGVAYGFAREGVLFEVEFFGNTVTTTPINIPGAPPNLEFFGAGSTTSAPPAAG